MTIVVPEGRSRTGVVLAQAGRVRRSGPLAWVTIATFTAATSAWGGLTWLAYQRDLAWSAAMRSSTAADIESADLLARQTLLASRAAWALVVAAAFAVALWSRSLTRNAQARGVVGLRPNRAALSWFVPAVGPAAAIRQIGRLVREFDYSERRLWFWLFGFHVYAVVMIAGQIAVTIGFHVTVDQSWSMTAVERQTQVFGLQAAMSLVLTLLAVRAIRHADRAVSGTRRRRTASTGASTNRQQHALPARQAKPRLIGRRERAYRAAA